MNHLSRRLVIALAISISINLFFGGFIAARFIYKSEKKDSFGPQAYPHGPVSFFGATEALGNPTPIERLLRKHVQDFRSKREKLAEARQHVAHALAADQFDAESLKKALHDLREATQESQLAIHSALVELAVSLKPQDRRMLANSPRLWRSDKSGHPRHQ